MKTVVIHEFGGPDVAAIGERAQAAPGDGEIRVRVHAVSINPLDIKIIAGHMRQVFPVELPYVPGTDFSGVVEAVGPNVGQFMVGDRVAGRTAPSAGGALAQSVVLAASAAVTVPIQMSFEQAAALPSAFGTAHLALFEVGALEAGQRVLVHAGAGGVGSFAIQLAKRAGAHVIATASAKNLALLSELGADQVIDYRNDDFTGTREVDLVLDPIGGDTLARSWPVLRAGGRIVTLVDFAIQAPAGYHGQSVFFQSASAALPVAIAMFQQDRLQIIMDAIYPLDEARGALEKVASGHARGKVVVRV